MSSKCPDCGNSFDSIGNHWYMSSCDYPSFTDRQLQIVEGLLMGDGHLDRSGANPHLLVACIKQEYLNYLDEIFGINGAGVSLRKTAKDSAESSLKYGASKASGDEDNYSDVYHWWTRASPELLEYCSWYASDSKVWPRDLTLTPTTLKHWYSGDGTYNSIGIKFAISNERKNTDKVSNLFTKSGLPEPDDYEYWERDDGSVKCDAVFRKNKSDVLLEYMGEPVPGFEYKWV